MNDHDALLRAICENPDEDTPRLVFADRIDDNADAFPTPAAVSLSAAFIRDDIRQWPRPPKPRHYPRAVCASISAGFRF